MGFRESCADPVNVRPLSEDEIEALNGDDEVYIPSPDFYLHTGLVERSRIVAEVEPRIMKGKVRVRTAYGIETSVEASSVYVPSEGGEEKWLMQEAGTRLNLTLFIPNMDEDEATERLRMALRTEFGKGSVQVWNQRSTLVRRFRRDVYEVRSGMVPTGAKPARGKKAPAEWKEVDRRVLARGVWDGHEHHFRDKVEQGWSFHDELHNPEITNVDTI